MTFKKININVADDGEFDDGEVHVVACAREADLTPEVIELARRAGFSDFRMGVCSECDAPIRYCPSDVPSNPVFICHQCSGLTDTDVLDVTVTRRVAEGVKHMMDEMIQTQPTKTRH